MENVKTYTKKERNIFLVGMTGQNIIYNIIGAALAYFLQFTILIPAVTVSLIVAAARIWDAFNDPIMGTIVDRTRTKWGKCRPYLIVAPIIIGVLTILCFVSFGQFNTSTKAMQAFMVFWAVFTYIGWGMAYTVGDIPLWGITALMTADKKDRDSLMSVARIVGSIGAGITLLGMQPLSLAIGGMIGNKLGDPVQGERFGFLIAAILFAVIGTCMFQLVGLNVKEKITPSTKKYTLKENFTIILKNKPFRQILVSGILGSARCLLQTCAMAVVTFYFASKNPVLALLYMVLLGGLMFIGTFVGNGTCNVLLKRFTKKTLYNWGNLLGAIPFFMIFILYLIAPHDLTKPIYLILASILFLISGYSIGISTVLQSQMIADCVDYEEWKNGVRPDALFFSGQTFIAKLQGGIATIISGIAYGIVGFSDERIAEVNAFIEAGGIPREAAAYSNLMRVLFILISIPPAISCVLCVLPTWKYALNDDKHKEILAELNERRRLKESENASTEES